MIISVFIKSLLHSNSFFPYISFLLSNLILGLVLFDDYILGNPTIKFYEKGVVFDRVAFYNWEELDIKEDEGYLKIKIKYYPKEIMYKK
ncbi:TPA: hypothetical protein HA335_05520 [Methanocaldococcus jannaschii]|nr:hypothetical protein [Methanocaldococcus jannaschii]HII60009.1 hypothetical protein [Methanocaldococcus jannaschii]